MLDRGRRAQQPRVHCLVVDGPGQGEALRLRAFTAVTIMKSPHWQRYDMSLRVRCRSKTCGNRGLLWVDITPRGARHSKSACRIIAWGAHSDYHAYGWNGGGSGILRVAKLSSPTFSAAWVLACAPWTSDGEAKGFTLEGVAQKITCPFLVVHGANDSIMPLRGARTYAAVASRVKTLKVFTTEEGGSEHCQGRQPPDGCGFIADWVADHLYDDESAQSLRLRRLWLATGWALVVAVVYLSVSNLSNAPAVPGGDKLAHLAAYGTLMFWFAQIIDAAAARVLTAAALIALGVTMELVQAALPYRSFELQDMIANTAGVLLGWLASPPRTPNMLVHLEGAFSGRRG